jgi:hypothetical protein
MEFFKTCLTGVYTVEDFSNVDYWSAPVGSPDGRQIEYFFRSQNILVRWNEKSANLWVFASPDGANKLAKTAINLVLPDELGITAPIGSLHLS